MRPRTWRKTDIGLGKFPPFQAGLGLVILAQGLLQIIPMSSLAPDRAVSSIMDRLPPEIIGCISDYCGQADACNLAMTCTLAAKIVVPRLFSCIVLDTGPRSLYPERPSKYVTEDLPNVPTTVVRTVAGLKQCLRALAEFPELAAKVWRLEVLSNVALSDRTLHTMFSQAFSNLSELKVLQWSACPELPLDVLATLPQKNRLRVLDVDLAVRPWQTYPPMEFVNLRRLVVRPFLKAEFLNWLRNVVAHSPALEEVWLCRFLDSKNEVGSSYAFVGLNDMPDEEVFAITHFFANTPHWSLRRLGLLQIMVKEDDAERLTTSIDLQMLEDLTLTGSDVPNITSPHKHSVLAHLMYRTPHLRRLQLDWGTPTSLTAAYIRHHDELESLHLHIPEDPRSLIETVSRLPRLKHLTLVLKCRFRFADFAALKACTGLQTLSMPFSFESTTWKLVSELPQLKLLELNYSAEGTANGQTTQTQGSSLLTSNLLTVVHEDDVYPLQYAGILSDLRLHAGLEHVQIESHLHTLKPAATDVEVLRQMRRCDPIF